MNHRFARSITHSTLAAILACSFVVSAVATVWAEPSVADQNVGVTAQATIAVGTQPSALAVDPETHTIYVANASNSTVSVIDGTTDKVVMTIPVGSNPRSVAIDPTLHRVYVANLKSDSVSVIDETTNQVVDTIRVGAFPGAMAIDPTRHVIFIGNDSSALTNTGAAVQVLDSTTDRVTATVPIGSNPVDSALREVPAIAVDTVTHAIFVASNRKYPSESTVTMLDSVSYQPLTVKLTGQSITDLAVDPATQQVLVTGGSGSLQLYDGSSAQSLGNSTISVPLNGAVTLGGVAVDPMTGLAYVTNEDANTVDVVDLGTNKAIASVPVGQTPIGIAVDSTTHRVYVANQSANTVTVLNGISQPISVPHDDRYFSQTGFRIDNNVIWDYFNRRGGVTAFGHPVSRTFLFQGHLVQFFQRRIVELGPNGNARLLNVLDPGLMPYTSFNGATFPSFDSSLVASAPPATDAAAVLAFVKNHAPDSFNGRPVNFYQTFLDTVSATVAFPNGGDTSLLPGFDLEMWGIPTSGVLADPNNHNFIYLRFQRGIMMYDGSCNCTRGVLLADYLKDIITGQNLPPDLNQEAQNSPFYKQYDPSKPGWVRDPGRLPNTDLTNAFSQE